MSSSDETVISRVEKFYIMFPDATNEQLYAMFPDISRNTLKRAKKDAMTKFELANLRKIVNEKHPDLIPKTKPGVKDSFDLVKIPKKETAGRHKLPDFDANDKPEPTGRVWMGEHWRVNSAGRIEWFMPPKPDRSFAHWYEIFYLNEFNFPEPDPIGACHREWGSILQSLQKKLIFLCSRDHFKSSFINNGYITYNICEHQQERNWTGIMNMAWNKDLAVANMTSIASNLEANPLILDFYGYLIDDKKKNTEDTKYFKFQPAGARPGLKTVGFRDGKITGMHPHLFLGDDMEDEPLSEKLMKKFRWVFDKKVIPALGKHGRCILTGTIKGSDEDDDGYIWLEGKPTFRVLRYPAVIGEIPGLNDCTWENKKVPLVIHGEIQRDHEGKIMYEEKFVVKVKDRNKYTVLYPERYQIEDIMAKFLEIIGKGKSADVFYQEYLLIATKPEGKYFPKERIQDMMGMPFPKFHDLPSLTEYIKKSHKPAYLWIDPGGESKGSHGIAMVVVTKMYGCWFVLDLVVTKAPIHFAARTVARLIERWNVKIWGVEGNFSQKLTYGRTLDRELRIYLKKQGKMKLYKSPVIRNNTEDKIQRIREGFSVMLGIKGMDYTFYINTNAEHYQQFDREVSQFGLKMTAEQRKGFDILDALVSANTFLVSRIGGEAPKVASA